MLTWTATRLAAAMLASVCASPAVATTCDLREIKAGSTAEAAAALLDGSDYVGFGYLRDISRGRVKQQEVDFIILLKGSRDTVALAPEMVNGVMDYTDAYAKWLYAPADELRLFTLIAIKDGAAQPTCHGAIVEAKPRVDLYKALIVEAERRRTRRPQPSPAAGKSMLPKRR